MNEATPLQPEGWEAETPAEPKKPSLFAAYSTDPVMEQGVWIDYDEMGKIKIARAAGAKFDTALFNKMKPYRRKLQLEAENPSQSTMALLRRLNIELFAENVVLDWSGIVEKDGKTVFPYSKENAKRLLTDLPALFADIQAKAANIVTFQKADLDDDAKN